MKFLQLKKNVSWLIFWMLDTELWPILTGEDSARMHNSSVINYLKFTKYFDQLVKYNIIKMLTHKFASNGFKKNFLRFLVFLLT